MGVAKKQQNFRLPPPLIERLEGVCGKGRRFRDKSAAVEVALERLLGPELPARWATVANPAGDGTLVRVASADPGAWFVGALVRGRSGEVMRVRAVEPVEDGLLLTVDRGVGDTAVRELAAGDEVCQVGHVDVETSGVEATTAQDGAGGAGADGRSGEPDLAPVGSEAEGGPARLAARPASPELGGQGAALSVPAPPDLDGPRAPFPTAAEDLSLDALPVGRAELLEGRADADGDRSAAAQEAELVEVAGWLQARTGAPLAVCRKRIEEGRVTVGADPLSTSHLSRSRLELVELDGERV